MATNDFYFLVMVLGAFGAFALAMVIATLQYRAWLRQTASEKPLAANRNNPQPQSRAA
jgi:hypothetical protein